MNIAETLNRISELETQKQNISNQAAFSVGQQLQPIQAEIDRLKGTLIEGKPVEVTTEAASPAPRKGRPKGSKNKPKGIGPNGQEATA